MVSPYYRATSISNQESIAQSPHCLAALTQSQAGLFSRSQS
jgi:hypothetical protein